MPTDYATTYGEAAAEYGFASDSCPDCGDPVLVIAHPRFDDIFYEIDGPEHDCPRGGA